MNRLVLAIPAVALSLSAMAEVQPLEIQAPQAQLTMAQAVVIAESMGNGRAVRARLDDRSALPVYKVTVKSRGEAPLKLEVAARGGRIVASERQDHDD
ncbi:PepSY domain-containing protein [Ramlibacter sp. RBP-2]|uniref:PepSY domain-containing protein n=1 Tax=Ramlibacter lithotrophicus TaxID=2606681 RepID=A0A7X6DIP3_9BURK|nr:PepSY domain-containing protein [Ramlibacter lithotrophicus]NKE67864.1 PepSY domain-containing protein [Ramlibacter lithotrophicus]